VSSRPPELTYFVDRSLGKHKVADALRAAGRSVVVHDDIFGPATSDEEWLSKVGESQWIVLTKDEHIRYRENERSAVQKAGVRLFVLTSGNLTGDEMASIIVGALPRIERAVHGTLGSIMARIDRRSRVIPIAQ